MGLLGWEAWLLASAGIRVQAVRVTWRPSVHCAMCGLSWLRVQSKLLGGVTLLHPVGHGASRQQVKQRVRWYVGAGQQTTARSWRAARYHALDELRGARCWLLAGMQGDGRGLSCNLYEVCDCSRAWG